MKHKKIIQFNAQERLLAKVRRYITAVDKLIDEADQAIALFNQAIKIADNETKLKIVLMLGTLACPQVVAPLFNLMHDTNQSESIRHAAAVQLSIVGGIVKNSESLVDQLIVDLNDPDPLKRANAAFALGWEGNLRAVAPLVEALYDNEQEVQQAAVNALSNLRDERVFKLLARRLDHGSKDQQRSILYNLWRFPSQRQEVVHIYSRYLQHPDADLRFDALAGLDAAGDPVEVLPLYQHCFQDPEARIRELALVRLAALDQRYLKEIASMVRPLVQDPVPTVRQAAIKLLHHICPSYVASQAD